MKKQHKRALIFIGLKLAELIGFVTVFAAWLGLIYLITKYEVIMYIFIGIFSVLFIFFIICVIKENWAWAGRIAKKK